MRWTLLDCLTWTFSLTRSLESITCYPTSKYYMLLTESITCYLRKVLHVTYWKYYMLLNRLASPLMQDWSLVLGYMRPLHAPTLADKFPARDVIERPEPDLQSADTPCPVSHWFRLVFLPCNRWRGPNWRDLNLRCFTKTTKTKSSKRIEARQQSFLC